jgi:multisubunit Na+/H+ antiporter MnhB subunit
VEPDTKSAKLYLLATIGFLVFTIVCAMWLVTDIRTRGSYPIKLLGCVFAGVLGTVGCFVIFLRIILGYEDKQNQKYYEESLQRLKNKNYVEKLISYGYHVPEKFR